MVFWANVCVLEEFLFGNGDYLQLVLKLMSANNSNNSLIPPWPRLACSLALSLSLGFCLRLGEWRHNNNLMCIVVVVIENNDTIASRRVSGTMIFAHCERACQTSWQEEHAQNTMGGFEKLAKDKRHTMLHRMLQTVLICLHCNVSTLSMMLYRKHPPLRLCAFKNQFTPLTQG